MKAKRLPPRVPPGFEKVSESTLRFRNEHVPEDLEVVIGDEQQAEFWPRLKLKKWENESNISLGVMPEGTEEESVTTDEASGVVTWAKGNQEVRLYALENPDGSQGFEFAINLRSKPTTNVWYLSLQTKGVQIHYQPDAATQAALLGLPVEAIDIPDYNVGSLEIYSAKRDGKYKTGKVAHLYRPKAIDARNREVWCEYNTDPDADGFISVTVPQEFLDSAKYPVLIDPTAGWSTAGGTAYSMTDTMFLGHNEGTYNDSTGTLGTDHQVDTNGLHAYLGKSTGTVTGYVAVYEDDHTGSNASGDALVAESSGQAVGSGPTQYDFDVSNATLPAGSRYVVGCRIDETVTFGGKIYGTYVAYNESRSVSSVSAFPATLPNPINILSTRYSLWMDYSEAGGGATTYSGVHTTDAVLYEQGTSTVDVDSVLQVEASETFQVDALLQVEGSVSVDTDALLQDTGTKSTSADAVLASTGTVQASCDTALEASDSVSGAVDAYLSRTWAQISLDAFLEASLTPDSGGGSELVEDSVSVHNNTQNLLYYESTIPIDNNIDNSHINIVEKESL